MTITAPTLWLTTIATPTLWFITLGVVVGLLVLDFLITRKPHEVEMKEAIGWSIFYVALPLLFGLYVLFVHGSTTGIEYYTGYVVEKSLSVDNLFVFMLLLGAFAVPKELQQRVLLFGIVGALILRGIFIALGAAALNSFDWVFLLFGAILLLTGAKLLKDALSGKDHEEMDVSDLRVVKLMRKRFPVVDEYEDQKWTVVKDGQRHLTPLFLVVVAVFATDVVFAVDSVPAVYGITEDPYLVFVTNAFALLGLRALYFVLEGALDKLRHLSYGLSAILVLIGVKLVLHWAHETWDSVPEIPTLLSLGLIVLILAITTFTSLAADKKSRQKKAQQGSGGGDGKGTEDGKGGEDDGDDAQASGSTTSSDTSGASR